MKSNTVLSIGLFALLAGFAVDVAAEKYMYKWKAEDGEIHYTERPPKGVEFTRIRVADDKGKPAAKPATNQSNTASAQDKADEKYEGWRKENCKIATQNLDVLQNAGRIAQDDGQGGTRLMTDEEKAANVKKMQAQKDKYCKAEDSEN